MTVYTILETAIIGLIGVVSAYHVMRMLMPRMIDRARMSVALRLGRSADATSWRHAVAAGARNVAPENACGAGCNSGCNGCSVAARASTLVPADEQSSR